MDFIYLALGSNLGNRKENLEIAIKNLEKYYINIIDVSPLYVTPALMLKNSPSEWNIPFLNCVVKVNTDKSPNELLDICKKIEKEMGRDFSKKWSPRQIDIDILFYKDKNIESDNLNIPHKEINKRSFVLDPLSFIYPDKAKNYYRDDHQPVFMGILNVTPDSFSDGGKYNNINNFKNTFDFWEKNDVSIIDIGAESTRPGAEPLTFEDELIRLRDVFLYIKNREKGIFRSLLSIDTYHYKTAEKAIENGFNIVNDVSGLDDNNMIELAKDNRDIKFIFMHNLGVPSDKSIFVKGDVLNEVERWIEDKINIFEKNNLNKNQLILDLGIGFGKTPSQNLQLLQNISNFHKYGFKILIGHSRKSFMKIFDLDFNDKDIETMSISMQISKYVDIIRVHTPIEHKISLISKCHCMNQFI